MVPSLNSSLITMNTPSQSSTSQNSLNLNALDIENSLNELHKTFYTEFSLMTAVRLFFKPDVLIQRSTDLILSKAEGFHLIGFQIRMGSGGSDFTDSHTFLKMGSLQKFIDFAEAYRIQRGIEASRVRWYVSTDSSKAERKLRYAEGGEVHGRYEAERRRSERELLRNIRREHGIDAADEHSEKKRKAERYPKSEKKRRKKSAAAAAHIKPSPIPHRKYNSGTDRRYYSS